MSHARVIPMSLVVLVTLTLGGVWTMAQGPQPAFGQASVSPPNIVFDTPTLVTFTIRIDTPTLNPTTVELQRVDASGDFLGPVGRMFDNGQGGDVKSGDRVFTAVVTLNQPQIGKSFFRVTAAFRGNKQNAFSSVVPLDVDPFPLPPDPGEAGKQTLEGIDSDQDGVRDDVQRYIGVNSQDGPTKTVLTQYASAIQNTVRVDRLVDDTDIVRELGAVSCLTSVLGATAASRKVAELKLLVLNTDDRLKAYLRAGASVHGLPEVPLQLNCVPDANQD